MTSDALSSRRNNTIDAFRGIAILGVLVYHYSLRWAPPWSVANLYGYRHAWPNWLVLGALGVHVFFVISGLVITMTVLRSKSALEFAVRRLARLYPAFLVGICLTLAATGIFPIPVFHVSPADVLANLTMEAPAFHRHLVDGSYWTLCVEIKFYALVALSFALLGERFWIAIAGIAALGLVVFEFGTTRQMLLAPYAPLFLAGMAIWYWLFERKMLPALVLTGESLVLYAAFRHSFELPLVSPFLCHLCIVLPVSALVTLLALGRNTRMGPLAPIGRISYSLYLIHQNLGVIIIASLTAIGFADIWAFLVATGFCIALAAFMFRYVEQPVQRAIMAGYRWLTAARASADLSGLVPGRPAREQ
jgi:peptidoglycan/LPS O-acetylase OafA/YrhL